MTGIINPRKAISLNSVRGSRRTSHPSTRSVYRRGAPEVSIRWSLDREGVRTGPNRSARLRASEPPNSSFPTSRLIWKNTFCSNVRNFFSEINLTNWRNHFFFRTLLSCWIYFLPLAKQSGKKPGLHISYLNFAGQRYDARPDRRGRASRVGSPASGASQRASERGNLGLPREKGIGKSRRNSGQVYMLTEMELQALEAVCYRPRITTRSTERTRLIKKVRRALRGASHPAHLTL